MELIERTAPDLILMDIRLKEEEDGIAVAGRVRDRFGIPLIYVTASDDGETLARADLTQPCGYIKKPITTANLREAIESAFLKRRAD